MRPSPGNLRMLLGASILVSIAAALACGKKAPPLKVAAAPERAVPWTQELLNGVLVVRGEADRPLDLVLEGRSIRETRHADAGPVRWELPRPPSGEVARLRTAGGKVLAEWRFGRTPRVARVEPRRPEAPRPAVRPYDPYDSLRRQLAAAPAPAPILAAAAPEPVLVPVLRAEVAPLSRRPALSAALRPKPLEAFRAAPGSAPLVLRPAPLPGPAWPGSGEALNLLRGPKAPAGGQKQMILSFDGGSSDESAVEILDALQARNVRTTIFLTGDFILKYPELVRRMAREGHELGNHTMNHPHFAPGMKRDPRWTKERFQEELLAADRALYQVLGRPMDPYWRAPYGEQTRELREWAEEIGFRHVGWSEGADTLDWATPSEKRIYRSGDAVLARLHGRMGRQDADGLIVLMHLGSARPEADRPSRNLGAFMDRAAKEGWRFARVSDFLQEMRKPAWDPAARLALLESHAGASSRAALRK